MYIFGSNIAVVKKKYLIVCISFNLYLYLPVSPFTFIFGLNNMLIEKYILWKVLINCQKSHSHLMLWHSNRWPGTCIFAIIAGFQVMSWRLCMLVYKNKIAFCPLNSSNEYVNWLIQFPLTAFHQLICFCPSILLLLALWIFVIIVDDCYKFEGCSQSWMHQYWIFLVTRIP